MFTILANAAAPYKVESIPIKEKKNKKKLVSAELTSENIRINGSIRPLAYDLSVGKPLCVKARYTYTHEYEGRQRGGKKRWHWRHRVADVEKVRLTNGFWRGRDARDLWAST